MVFARTSAQNFVTSLRVKFTIKLRLWRVAITGAALMVTCFVLIHILSVQFIGVQPAASSAIWRLDGYSIIKPDRVISEMVTRAKLDHLIAPIQGLRGPIEFQEARIKGDEIYLLFRPNVSDSLILYRGRHHDGTLVSKMVLGFDA